MMLDLRLFDTFGPGDVAALPKKLRQAVTADRKALVTAELRRDAAKAAHCKGSLFGTAA